MFSSAAAGGSLIAASLVLVVAVSALIGFRGFRSATEGSSQQSVVLKPVSGDNREAGAAAKPAPVVIGGERTATRSRRSTRPAARKSRAGRAVRRARGKAAPARSGLAAPRAKAPVVTAAPPATAEAPKAADAPVVPATPVDDVVDDVTAAVEDTKDSSQSVGDVLLDLRDVLP